MSKIHNANRTNRLLSESKTRKSFAKINVQFIAMVILVFAVCILGLIRQKEALRIQVGDSMYSIEIANTLDLLEKGLSGRTSIPNDSGMLFVFPYEMNLVFWMKDTMFPLSIAYLSSDFHIRELYDMEPMSEREVPSNGKYQYALELPFGAFENSKIGDKVIVIDMDKEVPEFQN